MANEFDCRIIFLKSLGKDDGFQNHPSKWRNTKKHDHKWHIPFAPILSSELGCSDADIRIISFSIVRVTLEADRVMVDVVSVVLRINGVRGAKWDGLRKENAPCIRRSLDPSSD